MNQQDSIRYQVANIIQALSEQGSIDTLPRIDCETIGRAVQEQLRPRVVETIEELDALPFETIIRTCTDITYEASSTSEGRRVWFPIAVANADYSDGIALPATVLWVPEEAK